MKDPRKHEKIVIDLEDLAGDEATSKDGKITIDFSSDEAPARDTGIDAGRNYYTKRRQTFEEPFYSSSPGLERGEAGTYPKADFGRRVVANLIDSAISSIPLIIFYFIVVPLLISYMQTSYDPFSGPSPALMLLPSLGAFIAWSLGLLYYMLKDGFGRGQSIGKKMMNLMVVRLEDNRPCTKGSSAFRALIYFILSGIEIVVAIVNENGQRLGDMAAKTQVINYQDYR